LLPAFLYLFRLWNYLFFNLAINNLFLSFKANEGININKKINFNFNKEGLKKILVFEGLVIAVFSLVQYIFLPDMRFLFGLGWDRHYFRAVGSFLDPSFTGLLLVLSFIVWLDSVLEIKEKYIKYLPIGFLMSIAIFLTFSRAIMFVYFFSFVFILAVKIKNKKNIFGLIMVLLLLFLVVLVISPKPGGEGVNLLRTSSYYLKIKNYEGTLKIIKDNLLIGVGYNAFRAVQRNYGYISVDDWELSNAGAGADNSFLLVMATTGIFGLATFLWFLVRILKSSLLKIKSNGFSIIVFVSILSICIISFSINALFYPWIMFWLILILAGFNIFGNEA